MKIAMTNKGGQNETDICSYDLRVWQMGLLLFVWILYQCEQVQGTDNKIKRAGGKNTVCYEHNIQKRNKIRGTQCIYLIEIIKE